MASRRLAISSLLCDGEDTSSRPESRDSRITPPPALAHQSVAVRPYASPVRSAFNPTQNTSFVNNAQYERQYRRDAYDRSPTPPSPVPYAPSRSITPLPLALQPVVLQRRTPSPPPLSQPASPELSTAAAYDSYYVADENVPGSVRYRDSREIPSRHGLAQRTDINQSSSYLPYEPPYPPHSPIDIGRHEQQSRRAILQISPYDQPRSHLQMPNSPSVGPTLTHTHFTSVSPQTATVSPLDSVDFLYPQQRVSRAEYEHRNASYPQQAPFPAFRASSSVSPTIAKSAGPSGLDVLVQAATEERERIDENRRLSGGGESRYSPEASRSFMDDKGFEYRRSREDLTYTSASAQQEAYSPVAFRSDVRLHSVSPKPSPLPTPVIPNSYALGPVQSHGHVESPPRNVKRTRLSPEIHPLSTVSRSPETVHPPMDAKAVARGQVRSVSDPEKHRTLRVDPETQSAQRTRQSSNQDEIRYTEEVRRSASSFRVVSGSKPPPNRNPMPVSRRSPPRSRPKPKKPGSAALASLEIPLPEPKPMLMENDRMHTAKMMPGSQQTSIAAKPRRVPSSKTVVASVRRKVEDEDSTDFFLSAISSPIETQEAKPFISQTEIPNVKNKPHASRVRKSSVKEARDAPLDSDSRRSLTSEILDEIIPPSPEDTGNAHSNYESNAYETGGYLDDIDDELANAVGATTSGDEDHPAVDEFEEPHTDGMEVDVENELLSLLEDQSDMIHRPANQVPMSSPSAKHATPRPLTTSHDRPSMPPPDVLNAANMMEKVGKKDVKAKGKAKAKPEGTAATSKSSKQISAAVDEPIEKIAKPKASKPRQPKGLTIDKTKQAKLAKDTLSPAAAMQRGSPIDPSGGGTPVDEAFPVVTSSGRMVTKSKKVAAAAAAAAASSTHSTSHSKKKTSAVPTAHQEGSNEARSRSHSVLPRASVDPEGQREKSTKEEEAKVKAVEEAEAEEDDKLYCICKTKYDEDRVMIACDRCDEWYHTQCIDMPDLDIDLVDQFICPLCIGRNPNLQLRTTYKQRCFSGLNHPKPKSADACHKPSRGAFSKYCSDECGVKFMHRKAQAWASKGGDIQSLWAAIKDMKRREGAVTAELHRTIPRSILAALQNSSLVPAVEEQMNGTKLEPAFEPIPKRDENANAEMIGALRTQLDSISKQRELWKKEMNLLVWRERLLILAAERASRLKECGWDQRLCFGDEEVMEFGDGVLESYDESVMATRNEDENGMDVDEQVGEGEWWCRGKQKCERHGGWQKLRISEIKGEKEMKEDALVKLTSREREIRGHIEDILHPQVNIISPVSAPKLAFKLTNARKGSDDGPKKGKKKIS